MDLLENLRARFPDVVPVVITGYATVASVVETMKIGAFDYLPKPFTPDEMAAVAKRPGKKDSTCCADLEYGPDHRRGRDRKGNGGERDSLDEPPEARAFHRSGLRDPLRLSAGERTLWPSEGIFHRGGCGQAGNF